MCVFTGIQFTKAFHRIRSCGNGPFFGSNSNVSLTRQTCGYRSSRLAGSKRQALAFCYSIRIWYVFLISKCRKESDLDVCTTSVLAKRTPLRSANFRRILWPNTFVNPKSALHSGVLFASTELVHRPRSDCPLHFNIKNTYQIRTE